MIHSSFSNSHVGARLFFNLEHTAHPKLFEKTSIMSGNAITKLAITSTFVF